MLDYRGCGLGVMEMSHRSSEFAQIIGEAKQDLIDLMSETAQAQGNPPTTAEITPAPAETPAP